MLVAAVTLLGLLLGLSADSRARTRAVAGSLEAPRAQVAETERDGVLSVSVVDLDGRALGTAAVRLFWEHDRRYFDAGQGLTDTAGGATISRVPRGVVWVLAEASGYARASTQVVAEGGTRQVKLKLAKATSLTVRVTDEARVALGDATVLVTSADPLPFAALTSAEGRATLQRLGAPPFSVKVSAPGYESVTRSGVTGDLEFALRRLSSILVHVKLPNGEPAAQAQLEIGGASLWPARTTLTDARGDCKIGGLLPGSYDLRATKAQLVSRVMMGLTLERGQNQELTLTLEPGRFISALVTDGSGPSPHLVSNADVVLAEEGLSSFPLRGRTGNDGKVSLGPVSSGPATLSARALDFVGSSVVAVPDVLTGPVRIPLVRGGVVLGEVVDARGFPVASASIEIIGVDSAGLPIAETPQLLRFRRTHFNWALSGPPPLVGAGELGVMPGPIPPIPGSRAALAAAALDSADSRPLEEDEEVPPWITNGSGKFRAAPVTPGLVRALVRHPDFVEAVSDAVALRSGEEASVKLTLLRGGSLEGRLKDDRDQPVASAEVEVVAEHGTFQRATVTASDGSFAFSSLPREVLLNVRRAENAGRIAKRIPLTIDEGKRHTLDVTLPAARPPLSVTVLDDENRPLELAEVNALSLDSASPLRTTAFSDEQGRVEFSDALGLPLRISVQAPGFARQIAMVAATTTRANLELKLARGALIQGRVTALRGRRGVEGATVTLSFQGLRKTATTDANGDYRLADVALGPIEIHISHPDFAAGAQSFVVESTGRRDRAFELPAIDLEEPGSVEGQVSDERGEPAAGVRVRAGQAPSYVPAGALPRGVAVTDANGAFTLRGLASGTVIIDAFSPERGRGSAEVQVQSGRTQSGVRIALATDVAEPEPFAPGGVAVTLGERGRGAGLEVVLVAVAENSEAERSGLEPGDIIATIDGTAPTSMRDARSRLGGPLRSDVVLAISRGGVTQRLSVLREAVRR